MKFQVFLILLLGVASASDCDSNSGASCDSSDDKSGLLMTASSVSDKSMTSEADAAHRKDQDAEALEDMRLAYLASLRARREIQKKKGICRSDFTLGVPNTNTCSGIAETILDEADCIEAAAEAKATAPSDSFTISTVYNEFRPRGCFQHSCTEDPGHNCYFYNTFGAFPKHPVGTPVCVRRRLKHGSIDYGTGAVVCPNGYQDIRSETQCSEFASCDHMHMAHHFLVTEFNYADYDYYPIGCFLNHAKEVMFNEPWYDWSGKLELPTHPMGTPICTLH